MIIFVFLQQIVDELFSIFLNLTINICTSKGGENIAIIIFYVSCYAKNAFTSWTSYQHLVHV